MTPIDEQISQLEALATRHYPDDLEQRGLCLVRLLTERLRTYHTMLIKLPVKQMTAEAPAIAHTCLFPKCNCPMDPGPDPDWCARGYPHTSEALPERCEHGMRWDRQCSACARVTEVAPTYRQIGWAIDTGSGRLFETNITAEQRTRWQPVYIANGVPEDL